MWASDNITSKEYYSHLNHPFVFMLISVTTATSRLSHMSCQRLVTGPVTLCTTSYSPKGQGFYSSCIVVVVWVSAFVVALWRWVLRFLDAVCFRNREGIKRSCCGKTVETSAEEEEEEVANQMQQQGTCSSSSSALTARCEPAVIKGLAPQHKLQRETGLRSAS